MDKIDTREAMPGWYTTLCDFLRELKGLSEPQIELLFEKYRITIQGEE